MLYAERPNKHPYGLRAWLRLYKCQEICRPDLSSSDTQAECSTSHCVPCGQQWSPSEQHSAWKGGNQKHTHTHHTIEVMFNLIMGHANQPAATAEDWTTQQFELSVNYRSNPSTGIKYNEHPKPDFQKKEEWQMVKLSLKEIRMLYLIELEAPQLVFSYSRCNENKKVKPTL
jgi:hypothetical protein